MAASKDFATQIGALAVGSTAFALGDPSGGTLLATPLTALAALGLTLKSGCANKACEKAEAKVLEHLKNHPEYTSEEIERARAILKDAPNIAQLDPKEVTAHIHGKHLEVEMTRLLMAPLSIGADDHIVETIIKTTLIAGIAVCKQDTGFRAALSLEMLLETARKQGIELNLTKQIDKTTKETLRTAQDMQGLLIDLVNGKFVTLDAMKALAAEFGEHDAQDQGSLETFLKLRAQEYFALKSEVDNIDDGLKRLSNLKAAAQDAIARVNLDEVEELLSRVQEVELEEAAKTAELRANNALLRGRVEQAYRILCAAADSFAAVDPLEPARRKILGYAEKLGRHGMRFGGAGLPLSVEMMRQTATEDLRSLDAWLWAAGKNAEAIGLQDQGTRTDGPKGADLLAQAVEAYRAALEVYTRADHPVDWAMTQNNLGLAVQGQGIRTDGPKGADLLAQAVAAYRAALGVRTRADQPVDWAVTQNNLGNALQDQGTRTDGPKGADLLAQAVAAYRAALEVRTRPDHPVQWAVTQKNIAIALFARAKRADAKHPRDDLAAALAAIDGALEVYDPEHMSYNHGTATQVRANVQAALDALGDEPTGA